MSIFEIIFWGAIVTEIVIRAPIDRERRKEKKTEQRVTTQEKTMLGLLSLGLFLPLIYSATSWLDFANYTLSTWANWAGVVLIFFALLIFWRAHVDLKTNWSPSLEIREKHELITLGIYRYIRHPMYASGWLWAIAQALLIPNWLAGFMGLPIFAIFYFLRVRAEEKMMVDTFGEQYSEYMKKTGGIFPKFGV